MRAAAHAGGARAARGGPRPIVIRMYGNGAGGLAASRGMRSGGAQCLMPAARASRAAAGADAQIQYLITG